MMKSIDIGNYIIYDNGKIWTKKYKRFLKGSKRKNGYIFINALNNHLHRIIAEGFIPNINNKPEVNHINGVKDDNRVDNLEWVTKSENIRHTFTLGRVIWNKGKVIK